ncbi:hypothetical protein MCEMIH15_02618 [Caulobacteraceae bacterium]
MGFSFQLKLLPEADHQAAVCRNRALIQRLSPAELQG